MTLICPSSWGGYPPPRGIAPAVPAPSQAVPGVCYAVPIRAYRYGHYAQIPMQIIVLILWALFVPIVLTMHLFGHIIKEQKEQANKPARMSECTRQQGAGNPAQALHGRRDTPRKTDQHRQPSDMGTKKAPRPVTTLTRSAPPHRRQEQYTASAG